MVDYRFELYDHNQNKVADLTGLARNRSYTLVRNGVDEVSFDMDLKEFQKLALSIGYHPRELLKKYSADVKVKRNDKYMVGAEVVSVPGRISGDNITITVRCDGYLNMFKDRFITKTFTQVDRAEIARGMIDWSQKNGTSSYIDRYDFGVRNGPQQTYSTALSDRDFKKQNIKNELINSTELLTGQYDFDFTPFRLFNTYDSIGSVRDDYTFKYPVNIVNATIDDDASTLANEVFGIGSGLGSEALSASYYDPLSSLNYKIRQKIETFSNVQLQSTVEEKTQAAVRKYREVLLIPQIEVNGVDFDLNVIGKGDIIPIDFSDVTYYDALLALYRIEKIKVNIDDNNNEKIFVTLDAVDY